MSRLAGKNWVIMLNFRVTIEYSLETTTTITAAVDKVHRSINIYMIM